MKKLSAITLKTLRNEEAYTFHKEASALAATLQNEKVKPLATAYKAAFDALSLAIDKSAGQSAAKTAQDADAERDVSWQGANSYLKCLSTYSPDKAEKEAAATLYSLFEKYGNPVRLSLAEETGVIDNLIQSIEAQSAEVIKACAFSKWLADLKEKQEAFVSASRISVSEASAKVLGVVKSARDDADLAYTSLAVTVNALLVLDGASELSDFADKHNVLVEKQKAVIKARKAKTK